MAHPRSACDRYPRPCNVVAAGEDPDVERVADHLRQEVVFATPDWSLADAADAMGRGGFRHLVVCEGGGITGIVSVRDVVRQWAGARSADRFAKA